MIDFRDFAIIIRNKQIYGDGKRDIFFIAQMRDLISIPKGNRGNLCKFGFIAFSKPYTNPENIFYTSLEEVEVALSKFYKEKIILDIPRTKKEIL